MGQLVGRKDRGEVSLHFNLKKKNREEKVESSIHAEAEQQLPGGYWGGKSGHTPDVQEEGGAS